MAARDLGPQVILQRPLIGRVAQGVRRVDDPHIRTKGHTHAQGRREGRHLGGEAVVRAGGDDDALLSRRIFRDAHGEVIGFRTRAREHDVAKLGGKRGKELLRVIEDGFLDVTGVGVQRLHLFVDSRYDTRVGVTDRGNVVVNVEILISVPVEQRDALATYYLHRGVIEEPVTGSEALCLGVGCSSASDPGAH